MSSPSCLSPGDKLCSVEDCIPGTGVYLRHGYIYSSLAGYVLKKNEGEEVRGVVVGESSCSTQRCRPEDRCCTTFVNVTQLICSGPVMIYGPYFGVLN